MNIKKTVSSLAIIMSLIIILTSIVNVKALAYPALSYSLNSSNIYRGDSFDIAVNISGAADLYGASIDFCYDPSLMEIKSISKGSLLVNFNEVNVSSANTTGKISSAFIMLGNLPGLINGTGQLFVIHAKALKAGSSIIKTTSGNENLIYNGTNLRVKLSDSNGQPIDYSKSDFTIRINSLGVPGSLTAASVSYNSVKLSYGAVSGATGYEIYRAASAAGTYSLVTAATATSYTNTGLSTGSTYYYKVRAYRTAGTSKVYGNFTSAHSVRPVPAVPGNLTAVSASYNSVRISYGAVSGATGYEIYRASSSTGTYSLVTSTAAASYTNTGLSTGSTYYYKVRAYRLVGSSKVYGSFTSVHSVRPVPAVPGSLIAASASYNSVKISYGAVSGATGYEIYRAASSTGTYSLVSSTAATSYTNTGLSTGSTYYYKVRAYRLVGTSKVYGNFTSAHSVRPVPAVPGNLTAASASYNSVKISYGAVSGATGYEIYRAASSKGSYSLIKATTATSYANSGLSTGSTYYYKVRAYRLVGTSKVYGNFTSAHSVRPVPAVPGSLTAISASYSSTNISFSAVGGATGYEIYRASSAAGTYSLVTAAAATSYTNTGLSTGSTYYYKVRAYRLIGSTKVYGNFSSAHLVRPVPAVPCYLTIVSSSYNSVIIIYGAVSGATGYEIYRASSAAGTYSPAASITATCYMNTGLSTGSTYYYKVRAYRLVGTSKIYGNFTSVHSVRPIPSVPDYLSLTSASYNSVNINFGAVSGAAGYEIYRASSATGTFSLVRAATATSYTNTGLAAGSTYYYKVRAYRLAGTVKVYGNFTSAVYIKI